MTTRPKARRFRLRLGDEGSDALRTNVAPQRTQDADQTPARAQTRAQARPQAPAGAAAAGASAGGSGSAEGAAQASTEAERQARRAAAARPVTPAAAGETAPQDALFDESAADAAPEQTPNRPAPPPRSRRRDTPRAPAAKPARPEAPATPEASARSSSSVTTPERTTPDRTPADHSADVSGSARVEAEIEAIRAEELTGRQMRMAMRVAQRHGIKATSGLEAVRLLRLRGIDPFEPSALLDIVRDQSQASSSRALTTTEQPALPKAYRQPKPPAHLPPTGSDAEATRRGEISRIQQDIARRRRRRMLLLATRLMVFVGLPTLLTAWYFYVIATPLYATNSEFVIQQAEVQSATSAGGLAGMMGGGALGGMHDSVTVQSYLQSRSAMRRLDEEHGFKAYFQQPDLDPLRRLAPDATDEAAFRLYQDVVQVSYDPTEGIIRMEVIAADPETSEVFARALVQYAEEQVDQLTQRLRENQMRDAVESVEMAETNMRDAQLRVLELQERYQVLSSEVEVTLLTQQITSLETLLNQERLTLDDLLANARPNQARLAQSQRRISTLEGQVAELRAALTQGGDDGTSLARVQRELVMAESDVATRQMLMAQAMQTMESARMEANRQVRYLSMGVSPIAPDEPTYPRAFENTALAFLIFSGLYLMISMTSAILREQITG
ncbi:capsule biosynthesis protein [Pararhodobacter oceanensis]|uniref:capsule biosynthesis protein n=1 Tax=Pararhodobacter oceanensis TaxID=2172121 RepID=UPI003A90CC90